MQVIMKIAISLDITCSVVKLSMFQENMTMVYLINYYLLFVLMHLIEIIKNTRTSFSQGKALKIGPCI